jgi:7,8-dihydropterin-6-yl-methyl-4-(beta-D-ribofuranosyl)aminobenzene 5'-phosphate synthase
MPGHCTGWKATHAFAREFPEAFVQASVGTRLVVESGSEAAGKSLLNFT